MTKKTTEKWKMYRDCHGRLFGHKSEYWDHIRNQWILPGELTEVNPSECEFKGTLKLQGGACWYFRDLNTNELYQIQETELQSILLNHSVERGVISGLWGWVKKGTSVSIKFIRELTEEEEEACSNAS